MASSEDPKHGRPQRRAIGIVRVSRVSGRDGESFASPDEQRQRIEVECERDDLNLLDVIPELAAATAKGRSSSRTRVEAACSRAVRLPDVERSRRD